MWVSRHCCFTVSSSNIRSIPLCTKYLHRAIMFDLTPHFDKLRKWKFFIKIKEELTLRWVDLMEFPTTGLRWPFSIFDVVQLCVGFRHHPKFAMTSILIRLLIFDVLGSTATSLTASDNTVRTFIPKTDDEGAIISRRQFIETCILSSLNITSKDKRVTKHTINVTHSLFAVDDGILPGVPYQGKIS